MKTTPIHVPGSVSLFYTILKVINISTLKFLPIKLSVDSFMMSIPWYLFYVVIGPDIRCNMLYEMFHIPSTDTRILLIINVPHFPAKIETLMQMKLLLHYYNLCCTSTTKMTGSWVRPLIGRRNTIGAYTGSYLYICIRVSISSSLYFFSDFSLIGNLELHVSAMLLNVYKHLLDHNLLTLLPVGQEEKVVCCSLICLE